MNQVAYQNNGVNFYNLLFFTTGLKQFCDAVKIEIGAGTLDFLLPMSTGKTKAAKVDFAKFEETIVSAVRSIDRNGQPLCGSVSAKPPASKIPAVQDKYRSLLGRKICMVKLKDVSQSSKNQKLFQRAKDYVVEHRKLRIMKRKERLLNGLRLLKQKNKVGVLKMMI